MGHNPFKNQPKRSSACLLPGSVGGLVLLLATSSLALSAPKADAEGRDVLLHAAPRHEGSGNMTRFEVLNADPPEIIEGQTARDEVPDSSADRREEVDKADSRHEVAD